MQKANLCGASPPNWLYSALLNASLFCSKVKKSSGRLSDELKIKVLFLFNICFIYKQLNILTFATFPLLCKILITPLFYLTRQAWSKWKANPQKLWSSSNLCDGDLMLKLPYLYLLTINGFCCSSHLAYSFLSIPPSNLFTLSVSFLHGVKENHFLSVLNLAWGILIWNFLVLDKKI